jgi:hypothetical protein
MELRQLLPFETYKELVNAETAIEKAEVLEASDALHWGDPEVIAYYTDLCMQIEFSS